MDKTYFDVQINRENTMCYKYDFKEKNKKPKDCIPMWVADMDFRTAPEIIDALKERVEYGIFGYSDTTGEYEDIVVNWAKKHYDIDIESSWIVKTPGIIFALSAAVGGFTSVGDSVIIQQPVYHPFNNMVVQNGRNMVSNDLIENNGYYSMDLDDLENKIVKHNCKLFMLCNPHNPVGRYWTEQELKELGKVLLKHDMIVLSDEIHADFVWGQNKPISLLKAVPELKDRIIVCQSPSKTFNIAGIQVANIIIPNKEIRDRFIGFKKSVGYDELNVFALVSCMAAYTKGEEWYNCMRSYIYDNILYAESVIKPMKEINMIRPEATYLLWLDFRNTGLSAAEIENKLLNEAGVWFNRSEMFGHMGERFFRMNVACPRKTLEEVMNRIKNTFK